MKIAVIGAGIAGITLARELGSHAQVTVIEKSRGFGGRMATRRSEQWQFDHGAQFITARTPEFQSTIAQAIEAEAVVQWQPKIVTLQANKSSFKRPWFEPHYIATPSMNALAKHLALGIEVRLHTRVAGIHRAGNRWSLHDDDSSVIGEYDFVVAALPAPQCSELLPATFSMHSAIKQVEFSPCYALMLGFRDSLDLNFDAAQIYDSRIRWITVDSTKTGRSKSYSLLVHSDNHWAMNMLDQPLAKVQSQLIDALNEILDRELDPALKTLHLWRYARAEKYLDDDFLLDKENRLAVCGDWCGGNHVENAFSSGRNLAEALKTISI